MTLDLKTLVLVVNSFGMLNIAASHLHVVLGRWYRKYVCVANGPILNHDTTKSLVSVVRRIFGSENFIQIWAKRKH